MKRNLKSNSYILSFYIFSLVMILLTPNNVFEKIPLLKGLFEQGQKFLPALDMFRKYSLFPEASSFVYVLQIIFFLFFLFLPLYKQFDIPEGRYLEWKKRPVFSFFVTPLIFISISIGAYYFFPGTPVSAGGEGGFIDHMVYRSKFGFALGTATILGGQFLSLILLTRFIVYTTKLAVQKKKR